jgi:prepilin peptidase CpaA
MVMWIAAAGFSLLMAMAALSDLLTMTISNKVSLILGGAFLAVAVAAGMPIPVIALHIAAGLLVLTIGFAMFALGWIGGGDAKLAAATALWLGFPSLTEYLVIASALGGVLTLAILALRGWPMPAVTLGWGWLSRLREPKGGVPYGIALAAAALIVYPHSDLWAAALAR